MPAVFLPTTQRVCTTSLTDAAPQGHPAATPTGKVRTATVRFCNIGTADASADLKVVDTNVVSGDNDGYRAKTYPVPFNHPNSAPDFERTVVLTEGQKLQYRASADNAVSISVEWVEDDA